MTGAELGSAAALVVGSFVSTNVDNLVLLVGWLSTHPRANRSILTGYALGMGALLGLALVLGLAAELLPVRHLGWLGLVPIALGAKLLFDRWRGRTGGDELRLEAGRGLTVAVATTQIAGGVDTVLVFAPLFADSTSRVDLVLVSGFAIAAALWFGLARLLGGRAARLDVVERVGLWIAPLVMIAIGLYILDNTMTDHQPGH